MLFGRREFPKEIASVKALRQKSTWHIKIEKQTNHQGSSSSGCSREGSMEGDGTEK